VRNFEQEDIDALIDIIADLLGIDPADITIELIQDGDDVIFRVRIEGTTGGTHGDTINGDQFQQDLQDAIAQAPGTLPDRMGLADNPAAILNVYFTEYPEELCSDPGAMALFEQNIENSINAILADFNIDGIEVVAFGCEDANRRRLNRVPVRARVTITAPNGVIGAIESKIEDGTLHATLVELLVAIYPDLGVYVPTDEETDMELPDDGVATIDVAMRLLDEQNIGDTTALISLISIEGMLAVNYPWKVIPGDNILEGNADVISGNIEILQDCEPQIGQECVQRFRINMSVKTICNKLSVYDVLFPGMNVVTQSTMEVSLEMSIAQSALCGVVIEDAPVTGDIEQVDADRNPTNA
jgi:hypothetical protein